MLTVYKQITIKTLHQQGEKKARIARQIGCHRNTVHNIVKRGSVLKKQTRNKPSVFDPYQAKIKQLLDQDITRLRIHEILQDEYGIQKSYDCLCKYVKKHFPKPVTAYGVQVTKPGEEAELDFGYLGLLPDKDGKLTKTWGLVMVLSYSRKAYYTITHDQKVATWVACLEKAFNFFGGVPRRLKIDNTKAIILKNRRSELEFNQDFLEFAHHYSLTIAPCTPYHPQQKGKVEAGVKYLKKNFISGREFEHESDLQSRLKDWMKTYANQRVHGTTKKIPNQVFEQEERLQLQPLPKERYAFFQRCLRKVQRNGHLHFENNYYSVPNHLVGQEVTVRWNDHCLRVVYQGEEVALHLLARGKGEYVTLRNHLPNYKVYSETEYQARYEERMAQIGKHSHEFFRQLLLHRSKDWARVVRGILGLAKEHSPQAINLSLKRALHYEVRDLTTIRQIIKKRLYLREEEPQLLSVAGSAYGMSRPLSYYTRGGESQ